MVNKLKLLKFLVPPLLAALSLGLLLLPVRAITGSDIFLSTEGASGPDIEVASISNYTRLAVAYFKNSGSGGGAVYLKSATANPPTGQGWVTSGLVGFGNSPQIAFKRNTTDTVYVVWASTDNKSIKSAKCTLRLINAPLCTAGNDVRSDNNGGLGSPDIVVDGTNHLHVVWSNDGGIETARSAIPDSVISWPASPTTAGLCGGGFGQEPVVGWTDANDKLHLAFLCGTTFQPATSVEYRRSGDTIDNWADVLESFSLNDGDVNSTVHSKFSNVALAADATVGGRQVSLVWDARRSDHAPANQYFSLVYAASTNEGGGTWTTLPSHVPSGGLAAGNPNPAGNSKLSSTSTVPPQEAGLRPSLVISSTALITDEAAVVWQQRQSDTCSAEPGELNASSDVFFAPQTTPVSDTLQHATTDYVIDPDLAVEAATGNPHFVFMKDINVVLCVGGEASAYGIYYRGTVTFKDNDKGEEAAGLFLPVVRK